MLDKIRVIKSDEVKTVIEVVTFTSDIDIVSSMKTTLERNISPVKVSQSEDGYPCFSIKVDSYLESYFYNEVASIAYLKSIIMSSFNVEEFKDVRISLKPVVYCSDIHVDYFNLTFNKGPMVKLLDDDKVLLRINAKANLLVNGDINTKLIMQMKHLTDCGYLILSTKREDDITKIKSSKNLILNEMGFLSVVRRLSKVVKEMQDGNTSDVKDQWVYSIGLPRHNWWLLGNGLIREQIELSKMFSDKEAIWK